MRFIADVLFLVAVTGIVVGSAVTADVISKAAKDQKQKEALRQQEVRNKKVQSDKEEVVKKEAVAFLADIEYRLKSGSWTNEVLPDMSARMSDFDKDFISLGIRQKLNLTVGLYAYLSGNSQQAKNKFKRAKELGVTNPRIIVPEVWTSGSMEVFSSS